jgi:hypothetical protein
MTPTLPQAEIDRIAADANSKWPLDENDPPTKYTSSRNALMLDFRSAFIAGASSEAIRGREQMAAFAEWKDDNYVSYQMQDGRYYHKDGRYYPKRYLLKHISEATVYTTAELLDIYILDTQKRNG